MWEILALIIILGFVVWLFLSHKKKIPKPRYTEKNPKYSLFHNDKMLGNITQIEDEINDSEDENQTENTENKGKEHDEKDKGNSPKSKDKKTKQNFDLKNAMLSSEILNKKKKKH